MKDESYIQALYEEAVEQAADFADDQAAEQAALLHRHYAVQLGCILEIAPADTEAQIDSLAQKLTAAVGIDRSTDPQACLQHEVDRILDGAVKFSEEEYRHLIGRLAEFEDLMDLPLYDILQQTAWQILKALHPQMESYELEGLLMEDMQQALKAQSASYKRK